MAPWVLNFAAAAAVRLITETKWSTPGLISPLGAEVSDRCRIGGLLFHNWTHFAWPNGCLLSEHLSGGICCQLIPLAVRVRAQLANKEFSARFGDMQKKALMEHISYSTQINDLFKECTASAF